MSGTPEENTDIAWVSVITDDQATGDLAAAYDAVRGKNGKVENLYLAMSQTPQAIKPADAHYLAVLHNSDSPLRPWLAELLATYVAILCNCDYAAVNHGANFATYFDDDVRADEILNDLRNGRTPSALAGDDQAIAALNYSHKLSTLPADMTETDVRVLKDAGYCDKGVSYIIQIVASFAYWARMINGLGTRLGDTVGLDDKPTCDEVG